MRRFQCKLTSEPPVRWWLSWLVMLAIWAPLRTHCLRANSGVTDPWGENLRPKLYTDYLTQHSGKNLFCKKSLILLFKTTSNKSCLSSAGETATRAMKNGFCLNKLFLSLLIKSATAMYYLRRCRAVSDDLHLCSGQLWWKCKTHSFSYCCVMLIIPIEVKSKA